MHCSYNTLHKCLSYSNYAYKYVTKSENVIGFTGISSHVVCYKESELRSHNNKDLCIVVRPKQLETYSTAKFR